jgi:hypothetical protein
MLTESEINLGLPGAYERKSGGNGRLAGGYGRQYEMKINDL